MPSTSPSRSIAIVSLGSRGDLFPLVAMGQSLQARGHDVTLFEYSEYAEEIERAGLRFGRLGEGSACHVVFERNGNQSEALLRLTRDVAKQGIEGAVDAVVAGGPFDAVVAHHFQPAGQLAAELLGVPLVSIVGSDIADLYFPPRPALPGSRDDRVLRVVDRLATANINAARRAVGLPERSRAGTVGGVSEQAVLVPVSGVLLSRERRWPAHFRVSGYPAYDGSDHRGVPSDVRAFADRSELGPLMICTLGDSWASEFPLTCQRLAQLAGPMGFRILFLVCRGSIDAPGENCMVRQFVPLTPLMPSAAAMLNHAGRGTLMTGLRFGVPALLMPHWLDGFDNARRVAEWGAGRIVSTDMGLAELRHEVSEILNNGYHRVRAADAARVVAADPDPGQVIEESIVSILKGEA